MYMSVYVCLRVKASFMLHLTATLILFFHLTPLYTNLYTMSGFWHLSS